MLYIGLESSGANNYVQLAGVLLQKKKAFHHRTYSGREFHGGRRWTI